MGKFTALKSDRLGVVRRLLAKPQKPGTESERRNN
jgi:hypothetical protein